MARLLFITHPEVVVEPAVPVDRWGLSPLGQRRMLTFAESDEVDGVAHVWASGETKAREAAAILADRLELEVRVERNLGENDRSATGYLPPTEFERVADAFFARPDDSIRGWERASDAQRRIIAAVRRIVAGHGQGDVAVVAHGAVGTLLLCALKGLPIDRAEDQPSQGHYWTAELPELRVLQGWLPIARAE